MTRTRRQNPTASDVRRMGGAPLDLKIAAVWLDYAFNVAGLRHITRKAIHDALGRVPATSYDLCALKMSERDAKALAAACEAAGRLNTAAAIRGAVKAVLEPPEVVTPLEHLDSLAAEGALEPDELEALRRIMGGPKAKGGLFGG